MGSFGGEMLDFRGGFLDSGIWGGVPVFYGGGSLLFGGGLTLHINALERGFSYVVF